MNTSRVVKVEATHEALKLRLWTDDENGQHLAVSEVTVPAHVVAQWWLEIRHEQDQYQQPPLWDD
jgi:hypothetical protein